MKYIRFCAVLLVTLILGQAAQAQTLSAHAEVAISGQVYSYTVFNDEALGSPNYSGGFYLSVNAPFTVTGSPNGWNYVTDGTSYVNWNNTDTALPYPHDIAPGTSLSGFTIEASVLSLSSPGGYQLYSWDHVADAPGPNSNPATILAPGAAPVPESSTFVSLGVGLLFLGGLLLIVRNRARKSAR